MREEGSSVLVDKKERINGWSWPPHPFQLLAWFFVISLPLIYYGVLVPRLPHKWIPAGCIVPGLFLSVHLILHLVCLTLDPADPKIRQQKLTTKATEFSRAQHKHVIENDHCYICQVDVGKQSKHCALCNKCISEFDHHCKWLNNCIGGQNYKLFISCLMTALATAFALLAFCLYLFIMYFKNRESVMEQAWGLFGDLDSKAFVTLTAIMILLLILAILLLGHLLCFHIFLIHKGLSTYGFIVQNREACPNISLDTESVPRPPKLQPCKANKIAHNTTESTGFASIEMQKRNGQKDCKIEMTTKTV